MNIICVFLFQSTHPRGVRQPLGRLRACTIQFQSTHPRGVRPGQNLLYMAIGGFNPRTHEGCDCNERQITTNKRFQSTHPRGVRLIIIYLGGIIDCFNPRTHEGCDRVVALTFFCKHCFNPRTHEGCDARTCSSKDQSDVSIHAPTRGATFKIYFLC